VNKTKIEWTDYTANLIRYSDAGGAAGEGDATMSEPKRIHTNGGIES